MRQPSPRWEAPSTRAISRPTDGFSATMTVLIPPAYHKPRLHASRGGSAACQCLWLGFDADPPHEQGAGLLRCVSCGAVVRADGARPTSRGRTPAAIGDGDCYPFPKPPQAASPCSWTCRRLPAHSLHSERNEAPKPPERGAWAREHGAKGTVRRHCRPAGGKSLLVDLPPSARTVAPFGTKRSAQAPCSWGLGASPRRRRLWLPAPPARPYAKFMYIFSLGVDFWRRFAYNYTL